MSLRPLALVIAAAALLATAGAQEACQPTTSHPAFDTHTGVDGVPRFYADATTCAPGDPSCHILLWIYEETNGIDGLQRDDALVDDTCGGRIDGDTVVF